MIGLREGFADAGEEAGSPAPDLHWLPEAVDDLFAPTGALVKVLGLRHRPPQGEMAGAVARAMVSDTGLLCEAGTGVGKSLAYLIPGILHACREKRQCLVSTNTIALQEQILHKDLGLVRQLFAQSPEYSAFQDFQSALLIGKRNYLCGTRLAEAAKGQADLFSGSVSEDLKRIQAWAQRTETGTLAELDPPPSSEVWDYVNADGNSCNPRNCSPKTCFYRRARLAVEKAQVLIVNHSLLFALLGAGFHPQKDARGVLHPEDFVVLDEAHTVPAVATEHLGDNTSNYGLRRLILRLYNPARGKGMLRSIARPTDFELINTLLGLTDSFFDEISHTLLEHKDIARIHRPAWAEPILNAPMTALVQRLGDMQNEIREGPAQDELRGARASLLAYNNSINNCLELADEAHVYWAERIGKAGRTIALRTAPIDVAPYLRERLFQRQTSVVMTSATMNDGGDLEGFRARTGADAVEAMQTGSPFDYPRTMRVYIATDAPAPEPVGNRLDLDWMAAAISRTALAFQGGTLALFTSYRDMQGVCNRLAEDFQKANRTLLMQGRDGSRTDLRNRFAELGNALLLGTDSFWNGVDVPGPALSHVIITRLPFENPSHPVAEARSEWMRKRGESPFLKMTLPDAVVKFRQGIGRLIRTQSDIGTVTILDPRILNKPYGRRFLAVLPNPRFFRFRLSEAAQTFKPWESTTCRS